MNPANISIQDYSYTLPEEKIAMFPLAQRDASKLLVYKAGKIEESVFTNIAAFISPQTLMVFNNTKVMNARIRFKKTTGAAIEIFCLEPQGIITEYSSVMNTTQKMQWNCLVGGAAKWKNEVLQKNILVDGEPVILKAKLIEKLSDAYSIELSWNPSSHSFAAIIEAAGDTPLPPYIKRSTDAADSSRYQTIFALQEGSVAAPTAGLHFTENIFKNLAAKNISKTFVTLHVGAGTFKPVKAATMQQHQMHAEYIDVDEQTILQLKKNIGKIAAVGTTSLRTIETLYWLGVKTFLNSGEKKLFLKQWDVYEAPLASSSISATDALNSLLVWMQQNNLKNIFTQTQLLIAPGYRFRMANMLVTNFHQPQSTLLLLVAAAIGSDWKKLYDYALQNDFRFLSYGDGNLIHISS